MKKVLLACIALMAFSATAYAQGRTWGVLDPALLEEQGYAWEPNISFYLAGGIGTFGTPDLPDVDHLSMQSAPPQWELGMRTDSFYGFMFDVHGGQYLNQGEYRNTGVKLDLSQEFFGVAAYWVNRNVFPRTDLLLGVSFDAFMLDDHDFAGGLGFYSATSAWTFLLGLDYNFSQAGYFMLQAGYRLGRYVRFVLNDHNIRWVGAAGQDITYDLGGVTLKAGVGLKL